MDLTRKPRTDERKQIPRICATIYKIPKHVQMDGIALIDARLDPTLTGKMEQEEIAISIWMLTKIRPNFRIVDLRCEVVDRLVDLYKTASQREKDTSPLTYDILITRPQGLLAEDLINEILEYSIELGFDKGRRGR